MHSVAALVIPRPLSMGTDPVDGRNPKSPQPCVLALLLPPVSTFPLPHIHALLPLHVCALLPLRVHMPPPPLPLHTPLPGVAHALTPILQALHGGLWLRRQA